MIKQFYSGSSADVCRDLFAVNYPERSIPSASTIRSFEEEFILINNKNKNVPEKKYQQISSGEIAQECNIGAIVRKILHKYICINTAHIKLQPRKNFFRMTFIVTWNFVKS